jgi:3,4-dihydroxy-2-butanone 4-phosphate synthase
MLTAGGQRRNDSASQVWSPIKDIVADIRAGRMVVLVDEEDRENEGDLVLAAEYVTPKRSTSWPSTAAA